MEQVGEIKKILGEGEEQRRVLLKQTLFTVAYYNALGYYPTGFFIWKNLIAVDGNGKGSSLLEVLRVIDKLKNRNKIVDENGMYRLAEGISDDLGLKAKKTQKFSYKFENLTPDIYPAKLQRNLTQEVSTWYREQTQKNKISTEKIKRAKKWAEASRWVPYLRGLFLTGTLATKRGGVNSDWDVLVVLKKNRIWLGRLILTTWFHLMNKRRHKQKVENRFCLNQFVVDKELEFKEQNEFFGNELLTAEELTGNSKLKNKIIQKNKNWIKPFKPNFRFRDSIEKNSANKKNNFSKIIQKKLEIILETFKLAEMANAISKKIMIQKIINNPKTYSPGADIRYSDFFLVFLPRPQRGKIKGKTFSLLTKMNS
jgi:hypothetical protein